MKITINSAVLTQQLDDELVMLHPETGRYFGLKGSAYRLWRSFEELGDTELTIVRMLGEYNTDESIIRKDVQDLIDSLLEADLVSIESVPPR